MVNRISLGPFPCITPENTEVTLSVKKPDETTVTKTISRRDGIV